MAGQTRSLRPRFQTARATFALMLREMSSTYGRSPGGYVWAILEPVAAIAVLSFIFSYALRAPSLGTNFPLFYATAYLPFMMFNDIATKMSQSILFSRQLLSYPSVTIIDAMLARFLLSTFTHLMVFYLVIFGIHQIYDVRLIVDFPTVILALLSAAIFGLAVGTINCFLFTRFVVLRTVWSILMRPMFIISGVFFLYEDVPVELQTYLWYNPILHLTGMMRDGFYATYDATYVSVVYLYLLAGSLLSLGLLLLRRYYRDLLER
ncbi:capsular polysaccharide transport system permease protein [Litoreibacter ascidiaceicola]|uniref:Transport permease protein n=1 Tax=Litoreibacter ascidiaceicola TaxID=1486859 RepID=A0A1M5DU00_9RHOB|nr:ABC transporter permease [Litoreibacter ascidiaceicola]SHF70420.1 capsular polysaccharide transport system permease protein [Litoreibacter ascidiaceicola]